MEIRQEERGSKGSFFVEENGVRVAESTYSRAGATTVIIDHTEVADQLRGTGAGLKLIEAAVAWARREHVRIIPLCPFASSVFAKEPSLRDVLAT